MFHNVHLISPRYPIAGISNPPPSRSFPDLAASSSSSSFTRQVFERIRVRYHAPHRPVGDVARPAIYRARRINLRTWWLIIIIGRREYNATTWTRRVDAYASRVRRSRRYLSRSVRRRTFMRTNDKFAWPDWTVRFIRAFILTGLVRGGKGREESCRTLWRQRSERCKNVCAKTHRRQSLSLYSAVCIRTTHLSPPRR